MRRFLFLMLAVIIATIMVIPLAAVADANTTDGLSINGKVTVNGNQPGNDNIFTFKLLSADEKTTYGTAQNDAAGNITFNAASLSAGTYTVKQLPTDTEKQNHVNMTFDESSKSIKIEGMKATEGATWFQNNGTYSADGGTINSQNKIPITIYQNADRTGKSVYGYCIQNKQNFPYTASTAKSRYTAHLPVTIDGTGNFDVGDYTEKKMTADEKTKLRQIIYYYTVNKPSVSEWEDVEIAVAYLTGIGTSQTTNSKAIAKKCSTVNVPKNFTLVVLTSNYSSSLQNLITGYVTDTRTVTGTALFANSMQVEQPVNNKTSVIIKAKKTLDGEAPTNKTFEFELLDGTRNVIDTASNDGAGNIAFDSIEYSEAGSYTYIIREVDDGQTGIIYDTTEYTITVTVTSDDLKILDATKYYGISSQDGSIYVSTTPGSQEIPVYCIDQPSIAPAKTATTQVTYNSIVNPTNDQLESYVTNNKYGDKLAENLRKLMYYIDTNTSLRSYEKWNLIYAATDTNPDYDGYTETLNSIYQMDIPDSYQLVLFVPNNTTSGKYQSLLSGQGGLVDYDKAPTFANKTEKPVGKVLPDTGSNGTFILIITGLLLVCMATVLYKLKRN